MLALLGLLFGMMFALGLASAVFESAYKKMPGFRDAIDGAFGELGADDDEAYF